MAIVVTLAFLGLGWWQWDRATEGNALSWGYSVQWPLFGLFVIGLWIREIRADRKPAGSTKGGDSEPPLTSPFPTVRDGADSDAQVDSAIDEYNRYLAWLADNPGRRVSDYPG